jgi:hypothetical protein
MKLKGIVEEDFIQYKKPSMFLIFPKCNFKCDKECGAPICQNGALASAEEIEVDIRNYIVEKYLANPITEAIVCGGLEPFDSLAELQCLIMNLRYYTPDDIVIYTGYKEEEIDKEILNWLDLYGNIIIKFGRFIPNRPTRYDEILGVTLASDNQYAKRLNEI